MKLDPETKKALNGLFGALWGNRSGVSGAWGASSFRYHPTFIRRGPLLLTGETEFSQLHILNPPDAKVTPIHGNSCAHCNVFPGVDGEAIRIWESDDGPWWDMVRQELPKMRAELEEYLEAKKRKMGHLLRMV